MSIDIRPLSRDRRLFVPNPTNAREFRINEIRRAAAKKKWTFDFVEGKPWISLTVVDSKNRKNTVEIFDPFYSALQCSCRQFITDEANYCIHTAAIDNVKNNRQGFFRQDIPNYYRFWNQFDSKLIRLPATFRGYRGPRFNYYDSYKSQKTTHGFGVEAPINSVTCNTLERYSASSEENTLASNIPEPNDEGLLDGIALFDYQKVVFKKMVQAKRAICSMSVGSGKTLTTIACYAWMLQHIKPNARCLVIAPKALRLQWGNEFNRAIHENVTQVQRAGDLEKNTKVFITTYQYFTRNVDKFLEKEFDLIVADEIQFVKNADTKTWKAISKIQSEWFYGLSGTVIENRLDDLYSIMQIVNPGILGPRWRFNDRYQNLQIMTKHKAIYKGVKNLEELQDRLREHVFSYSSLVLPAITYHTVNTTLNRREKEYHDEVMEEAQKLIAKALNGHASPSDHLRIQGLLLKARQACNGEELLTKNRTSAPSSKIQKFIELVKDICIAKNEKLVVFSEWTEMLAMAQRFLPEGIGFVSYTGEHSPKKRAEILAKFQNDENCKIFFSSDAGGVGLDGLQLVSANIIHLELPWNPSRLDQRTGRVYRTRQTKPVNCYYIVSNGGIEQRIQNLLSEKRDVRVSTLAELD